MRQFEHLLVGLKLNELDATTLRYAGMIAREAESQRVSFMHVVESLEIPDGARDQYPEIEETPADVAEGKMHDLVGKHFEGHSKSDLRYEVSSGSPTNELLQYIPLHGIDLAIIGDAADKRDGGTVPERLARKAPCSVLIVPERAEPTVNKVLVPLDFSEHSAEALRLAAAFARAVACQAISCLHTFNVPPVWLKIGLSREEFLPRMKLHVESTYQSFVKGIDLSGLQVNSTFVPDERPARAIERSIKEDKPDLVFMGARGRTNAAAILLGSVTERVIRRTQVPLLAVKKKGEGLEFLEALLAL
jgi:nucleotide-binding universal stress UspA family protein